MTKREYLKQESQDFETYNKRFESYIDKLASKPITSFNTGKKNIFRVPVIMPPKFYSMASTKYEPDPSKSKVPLDMGQYLRLETCFLSKELYDDNMNFTNRKAHVGKLDGSAKIAITSNILDKFGLTIKEIKDLRDCKEAYMKKTKKSDEYYNFGKDASNRLQSLVTTTSLFVVPKITQHSIKDDEKLKADCDGLYLPIYTLDGDKLEKTEFVDSALLYTGALAYAMVYLNAKKTKLIVDKIILLADMPKLEGGSGSDEAPEISSEDYDRLVMGGDDEYEDEKEDEDDIPFSNY